MRKRMLRSVLVAAFSAVVTFGALGGVAGAESDALADTVWSMTANTVEAGEGEPIAVPADTVWS
ncbi:hypothetical protein ACIQNG_24920 [Streptomyces sp. NPDC091377]|uniref:hypothetical protein n=1 Tax=unclassified Streptomyces TaxID=2593676 RepID=UPI003826D575